MECASTTEMLPLLLTSLLSPVASMPCAPPLTLSPPSILILVAFPATFTDTELSPSISLCPVLLMTALSPVTMTPAPPLVITASPRLFRIARSPLTTPAVPPSTTIWPLLLTVMSFPVIATTTESFPVAEMSPSLLRTILLPLISITVAPFRAALPPWSVSTASLRLNTLLFAGSSTVAPTVLVI